jgi:hypothetical protein
MDLSASCLTYIFADRFVRRLGWIGRATGECAISAPSTGKLVNVARIEAQCVATALWGLQRADLLSITETPANERIRNSPWRPGTRLAAFDGRLDLRFQRVAPISDGLVGLEALLLAAVPNDAVDLNRVLNAESIGRPLEPLDALLVPVQQEAVAAGAICLSERPKRGRSLSWSIHSQYQVEESTNSSVRSQFSNADQTGLFGRDDSHLFSWVCRESLLALAAVRPGLVDPGSSPVW